MTTHASVHAPMNYVSTRGGMLPRPFTEILLEGLAPDGGLVVPESYPRLTGEELGAMRSLSYPELALEIIGRFATDIPHADLADIIDATYTSDAFGSADITPVEPLTDNLYLLCTSNGPSLAFKDIAMQLLGNLFPYVLAKTGDELNILGATSGDTGGAAIYAMRGKPGIRVFMLSPYQRTSKFQAAQMFSVLDPNIHNIAVRGVFDDCQDIVKVVGEDAHYKSQQRIGTVNSINWARVVAQVVYYFKGYFAVTENDSERVAFAVPSGNFGNIFAGHVARMMGLPIERLILATNENDVLDEFFRTGTYRPRASADVHATSSPSMDISKASNFERFVYDLTGRDGERTRGLYDEVRTGGFDLNGTHEHRAMSDYKISSGVSTHTDRLATIRAVYESCGRVIDTHTADGVKVAKEQQASLPAGTKILCIETALPIKFGETIIEALGFEPSRPTAVIGLEDREQRVQVVDNDAAVVMDLIARVTGLS
jgi:threonine synthase